MSEISGDNDDFPAIERSKERNSTIVNSNTSPGAVQDLTVVELLTDLLTQMKIMNIHLSLITEESTLDEDDFK